MIHDTFHIVYQTGTVLKKENAATYTIQYLLSFCTTNAIKLLQLCCKSLNLVCTSKTERHWCRAGPNIFQIGPANVRMFLNTFNVPTANTLKMPVRELHLSNTYYSITAVNM